MAHVDTAVYAELGRSGVGVTTNAFVDLVAYYVTVHACFVIIKI